MEVEIVKDKFDIVMVNCVYDFICLFKCIDCILWMVDKFKCDFYVVWFCDI